MAHLFASIGFSLLAVASFAFIVLTLAASREAILEALGSGRAPVARLPRRAVRIRSAGRWQAVQTTSAQPQRAAA